MSVDVVPYSQDWPLQFEAVACGLRAALASVPVISIEHVGSTSVPGLAAKPRLDIDIVVGRGHVAAVLEALGHAGYVHRGDLGVTDREAMEAPDESQPRNVYVCVDGTLHVRSHVAVRDILLTRPDLRDRYGAIKTRLSQDPDMDIATYLAGKSGVLHEVLSLSALTDDEKKTIFDLNTRS